MWGVWGNQVRTAYLGTAGFVLRTVVMAVGGGRMAKDIEVDGSGTLRCPKCGGTNLSLLGRRLRCLQCGKQWKSGDAKPYHRDVPEGGPRIKHSAFRGTKSPTDYAASRGFRFLGIDVAANGVEIVAATSEHDDVARTAFLIRQVLGGASDAERVRQAVAITQGEPATIGRVAEGDVERALDALRVRGIAATAIARDTAAEQAAGVEVLIRLRRSSGSATPATPECLARMSSPRRSAICSIASSAAAARSLV